MGHEVKPSDIPSFPLTGKVDLSKWKNPHPFYIRDDEINPPVVDPPVQKLPRRIRNNVLSRFPTCFLKGAELIWEYEKEHGVCTENWVYPIRNFGHPRDEYYAEIWHDGMDWSTNYWIIESVNFGDPEVHLIAYIDRMHNLMNNHDDIPNNKLNEYEIDEMQDAVMWYRRSVLLFNKPDTRYHSDTFWHFLKLMNVKSKKHGLNYYRYSHHSQKPVYIWMDPNSIPKYIMESKYVVGQKGNV